MSHNSRLKVKVNLFTLRRNLEVEKQRKYTWVEMAEKSGLNRKTLERLAQNKYKRMDFSTLDALLNFFRDEGMPIGIQDLLIVTEDVDDSRE